MSVVTAFPENGNNVKEVDVSLAPPASKSRAVAHIPLARGTPTTRHQLPDRGQGTASRRRGYRLERP